MNSAAGRPIAPPPPAAAIPRFLAQYPEISLDLSLNDALTDIVAERFDAGIRIGERIERDMIAVRVTDQSPRPSATRVRLVLLPGQIAGLEEGRSLNFTCGEGGTTLLVSAGERDRLVNIQAHEGTATQ
jgi:DNA-binding transcriptional LysR family regulator